MFAKDPSGYSLVRTTMKSMSAKKIIKMNEIVHTYRSSSLNCIDLRVNTPSSTAIVYHSLKSQCVIAQVNYLGRRCRLLSANICSIFCDIPCCSLCPGSEARHLFGSRAKCPDNCVHGIARSKVSILGSKLANRISQYYVLNCNIGLTGVVSMLERKAGLPSVSPEPLTSLTDCQRCEP